MALIDMKSDLSQGVGSKQTPQSFLDGHSGTLVTGQKSFGEPPRIIPAPSSLSALSRQSEQLNFKFNDTFNTTSIVTSTKDTLDTYYARAFSQTDPLGARKNKVFGPDEPFVLKEIGDRWGPGGAGVIDAGIVRGGIITQAARTVADIERIGKFLVTPRGLGFAIKQDILQKQNAGGEFSLGTMGDIINRALGKPLTNLAVPQRTSTSRDIFDTTAPTANIVVGSDIRTWRPSSIIDSLPIGFHSVRHKIPAGSPAALALKNISNFVNVGADGSISFVEGAQTAFSNVISGAKTDFSSLREGIVGLFEGKSITQQLLGSNSPLTSFFPNLIQLPLIQSPNFGALKNVLGGLLNQAKDLFGGIQLPNISLPQIPNFPKVNLPSIDLSPITDTFGKVAEAAAGIFPSQPKFSGKGGLGIGADFGGVTNTTFNPPKAIDLVGYKDAEGLSNHYTNESRYTAATFGRPRKNTISGIIFNYNQDDPANPGVGLKHGENHLEALERRFVFGRQNELSFGGLGLTLTPNVTRDALFGVESAEIPNPRNIPTSVIKPGDEEGKKLEKYNLLTYGQLNQKNSYGSKTTDANQTRGIGNQGGPARMVTDEELGVRMDGKYRGNLQDKINLHPYGGTTASDVINDNSTDFVPLKFRDMVNGKWMIFRAILESVTDTSSPEFSEERYIGRPEKVYAYQGATRNVNITFKVMPKSVQELITLWEKLNYLRGLSYPSIKENRMVAPFFNFTLGDMFDKQPMFFSSLNYTIDTASTWEIKPGLRLPKLIQVSADMRFIDKQLPTTTGKHYDLDWLKADGEFGTFDEDPSRATQVMPSHQRYDDLWSELKIVDDDVMDILLAGDEAAEALKETIDLLKSDPNVAGVDFPNPVSAFLK